MQEVQEAQRQRLLNIISACIESFGVAPTEILSGRAIGVDEVGELWAMRHRVPLRLFPADWHSHGKAAGPIRNQQMSKNADALVLIWDGNSRGSTNMKQIAQAAKLAIAEMILEPL